MLRIVSSALRGAGRTANFPTIPTVCRISSYFVKPDAPVAGFASQPQTLFRSALVNRNYDTGKHYSTLFSQLTSLRILPPKGQVATVPVRTIIKFSLRKGKRMTEKEVIKRFYRLDWGMWIRTRAGRHKRLWTKTTNRRRRLRSHVMTTPSQSWLLDTMVTKYWRRPKYYVDDPYNPYHKRESFFLTRTKPQPA